MKMVKTIIVTITRVRHPFALIGSRNPLRLLFTLWQLLRLRDFGSLKFVHLWIRSFLPGHTPLSDEVPWLTFKARAWLESYLKPNMSVFEYGSGGSTIFLSKKVKEVISIEHDKGWHSRVSNVLSMEGISNCKCLLYEPEKISGVMPCHGCNSYSSTAIQHVDMSFENYVKSIEEYPDASFDLVIVDGKARPSCILHALSKIRCGGNLMLDDSQWRSRDESKSLLADYLMSDDSQRQWCGEAKSLLANYKRTDFFGIGPYVTWLRQTSVWEIK